MRSGAWLLSLAVGFLSLSQEILWVRLVSFAMQGASQAFAWVLLLFLIGVALGASVGKRWCEADAPLLPRVARALTLSAGLDAVPVLLLPHLDSGPLLLAALLILVLASAAAKATVFPVAHHLGSPSGGPALGRSVSRVYFANIVGCTLGPVVTGYVLLDVWTVESAMAAVAVGSAVLAAACAWPGARWRRAGAPAAGAVLLAVAAMLSPPHALVTALSGEPRLAQVFQNRHGIIHTLGDDPAQRTVHGGNAYDGTNAVDLRGNANGLDRALALLAVHPQPARVLVLGMSAGAWTRVLCASNEVREITVLEINPAYVDLVRQSPRTAPLLADPRVHVHIDDGRRWLRRHPAARFDLIVQNTTFHWRAYSNNLLSREYLELARAHLAPGGIMAWNGTYSADTVRTAEAVFAHVERRHGFVYGSDRPFATPRADAAAVLRALALDGQPVFDETSFAPGGLAATLATQPFVPAAQRHAGLNFRPGVITDGNLLAEFAHGSAFLHDALPGLTRALDDWRER